MIFRGITNDIPGIDSIEQLDCCKLLGVFFQSNLKADSHVN